MAVLHSNDIVPTNADASHPFVQDSNLFWMTGIDQEESTLILFPDAPDHAMRELLFVKQTSKEIAIWDGHKLTKQQAREVSGIDKIRWNSSFQAVVKRLLGQADSVLIPSESHLQGNLNYDHPNQRFAHWIREHFPMLKLEDASRLITPLRMIKTPLEVQLIRKACAITERGFRHILSVVQDGAWEFEIEAEYAREFIRRRSTFAYDPIIGSGANSCVLHYIENNNKLNKGDVLLMDVGARYANYASDMTRTIPIGGYFTDRQREVYLAVLRTLRAATNLMKPGTRIDDYEKTVAQIIEKELVDLGLLTLQDVKKQDPDSPAYRRFYMHRSSHSLGLDVHDVSDRHATFAPGMVYTCEPGIYIQEENLGIRLENNILITERGNEDLMASIPIEADEIEALMNE
jgi:Xaa-Pro aminopeptidase